MSIRPLARVLVALGATLAVSVPAVVVAQAWHGLHDPCCGTCRMPQPRCTCTTFRPVVETRYRQEQVTTYRDVCETHLRQETVVTKVPVTRVDCVTVDEGCYQTVWVPKPVTKQILRTECIDQVSQRTVPFTVARRVPQVMTRIVPERRLHCVPETHTWTPGCTTCGPTYGAAAAMPTAAPIVAAPTTSFVPQPVTTTAIRSKYSADAPVTLGSTIVSSPTVQLEKPTPDPRHLDAPSAAYNDWTTIESRNASQRSSSPQPTVQPMSSRSTGGRFSPAPTAAAVWRSDPFVGGR